MDKQELIELIEFQSKELRDIIEHAVILSGNKITASLDSIACSLNDLNENLDAIHTAIIEQN